MTSETVTLRVAGALVTLPVETLTALWLEQVRQTSLTAAQPVIGAVRIGAQWRSEGGIYAGIARGRDGKPDYHLIVAEIEEASIAWQPAIDWVKSLSIDGLYDFTLPTRSEQALLYANTKDLFAGEAYWSSETYEGAAGCAWYQYFNGGGQRSDGKTSKLRARAVRRIPIQ